MTTLIVQDNDEDTLSMLTFILDMEGFRVKPVLGYQDDVAELVAAFSPALVLADYRLRGEDCISLCKSVKLRYPHLPVIVLSTQPEIAEKHRQHGFDNYLHKPFDLDELLDLVRSYLP